MLAKEEMEKIDKGWITINIIWIAMLYSLGIYLVIGLYIKDNIQIAAGDDVPIKTLRNALYTVSIITLILTKVIRNSLLKNSRGFIENLQSANKSNQHPAIAKYTTVSIVSFAMSESIGMYGLILVLLGKDVTDLYILIILSAIAMLYYRPKKEELINMAEKMKEPHAGL
jgi:hypothetical protein